MSSSRRGFLRGAAAALVGAPIALASRSEDEFVADSIKSKEIVLEAQLLEAQRGKMTAADLAAFEEADIIGRIIARSMLDKAQRLNRG